MDPSRLRVVPCSLRARAPHRRNSRAPASRAAAGALRVRGLRTPNPKYYNSEFGRFVNFYGPQELAIALGVQESAVYHWVRGAAQPKPAHALTIQRMARERGVSLSFEEIYGHARDLLASEPEVAARMERRKEKCEAHEKKQSQREAAIELLAKSGFVEKLPKKAEAEIDQAVAVATADVTSFPALVANVELSRSERLNTCDPCWERHRKRTLSARVVAGTAMCENCFTDESETDTED